MNAQKGKFVRRASRDPKLLVNTGSPGYGHVGAIQLQAHSLTCTLLVEDSHIAPVTFTSISSNSQHPLTETTLRNFNLIVLMDLLFSYLCAFSSTLATSVLLSILEAVRPFASLMSDQRCQCDRLNHGRRIRPLLNEKTYSNSEKNHWDLLKSSGSHGLLISFYICTRKLSIIHERHHCIMLNQKCKSLAT